MLGGAGLLSFILLRRATKKKQKNLISQKNKNRSPLIDQVRLAFRDYYTNIRKLKKTGYNSQLFQEINENLRVIGAITSQLEQESQAKKRKSIHEEYKKYKEKK
ncbi:MAG: hypothetical protein NY202_01295 [Mollicutes bacterium UO1]